VSDTAGAHAPRPGVPGVLQRGHLLSVNAAYAARTPHSATSLPQPAAHTTPCGRRARDTKAARSLRLQNQWLLPVVSASKLRQVAKAALQRIIKALCSPTAWSEQKQREHRARSMDFFEADTCPCAYDLTSGPMSGYFNASPLIIDAGISTATLSRDALA